MCFCVYLQSSTVGLLTMDQMKEKQEEAVREREKLLARKNREELRMQRKEEMAKEQVKARQKQQIKALSFNPDDDEEEEDGFSDDEPKPEVKQEEDEEESNNPSTSDAKPGPYTSKTDEDWSSSDAPKRRRFGKNPDVDTSFLPDVDRDAEENQLREKLRQEWEQRQRVLKEESIHITFSYWDGSGHRRSITMKKGNTIYQFLLKCLEVLRPDFMDLRSVTADQLMYVKEDLIIPQTNTFYDFIVTKARGKSGPLFSFDVHDDVRLVSDATVEKDESHAGNVEMSQIG